ncbi:MAG: type II secretion system protein [Opitutaceae bacterium]|jgi:prepilin-type N-terminal cleavage/methylation domain-containing protein/prepilin-type processing-associated H-X9-DG protein
MVTPTPFLSRRGFSLVELLTVVAVIGILAAITIPVLGRVRESTRSGQCVSNLRQIGIGIQLYAQSNRGRLPGPLYTAHGPRYTPNNTAAGSLSVYLDSYVTSTSGAAGSSTSRVQEMLNCPSWSTQTPDATGPSLQLNNFPSGWWESAQVYPFGDANAAVGSVNRTPRTITAISVYPQAATWMLVDVDKVWLKGATPGWANQIPDKPVHGSGWNCLYYDGHVGRISTSEH